HAAMPSRPPTLSLHDALPIYYRTEGIGATLPDGTPTMVTYAQVGMFRRDVGDAAGWWGADDDVMRAARTYGGDSFLSARLWAMGDRKSTRLNSSHVKISYAVF